eukprot:Gb_01004 [translate_table: standard]
MGKSGQTSSAWEDAIDSSEDETQEIARISSDIEKTRSQVDDNEDPNNRTRCTPERIRRVSYRLKPEKRSDSPSLSDIEEENVKTIFKNKPEADLSLLYARGSDKEIQERTYRILLPLLRKLVALYKKHAHLDKSGDLQMACAVCTELTHFRGWEALFLHTKEYWKSCLHQHKGYYRALSDAFRAENFWPKPSEPISWPPVLLVENSGVNFDGSLRKWRGLNGEEVPLTIKDLQIEEIIAVYNQAGKNEKSVVVYPVSQVGRVDAVGLNKILENGGSTDKGVSSIRLPNGDKPIANGKLEQCMNLRLSNGDKLRRRSTIALEDIANLKKAAEEEVDSDESDQSTCSSESENDYEDNHPLTKRASLERAVKLLEKFSESFQGSKDLCAFPHSLPFRKSKMLQEMDAKFQEDLKVSGAKGAAVNPEIRAQLEKIDQQLHKEKLQWLKDIHGIREQCEITGDSEPRARTGLERQVHMMRKGKTKFAQCEKLEQEQFKLHQRHLKHIEYKKKRQLIQDSQKRCDALLAAWQFEQKTFGKQAEIARLHRNILNTHYKNDKIKAQLSRQIYDSINGGLPMQKSSCLTKHMMCALAESDTESDDDCSYKGKTKVVNWSPRPDVWCSSSGFHELLGDVYLPWGVCDEEKWKFISIAEDQDRDDNGDKNVMI